MQKNILSLIKNYLFWTIFFVFFKCIFLLANYEFTSALTSNEIGKIFLYGLKMDLSAAGYLTLLPGLIIALSPLIGKICDKILSVYTMVILILMSIIGLADTSIYPSWGTRIDAQAIPYITDPVAVLSSVSTLQLIASIVAIIAIVTLFYILHKKLVVSTDINKEEKWYKVTPTILILTAALILPIRGGIDSAPLNFSSVYFSPKTYPNHAAYNFFWSFSYALTHNEYGKNPVSYMSDEEAERIMSNEIDSDDKDIPLVINKTDNKTNVILVILESFSNKTIYPLATANAKFDKEHNIEQKYYNPSDKRLETLTPNLNRYCGEGITFTNFYATGTRSDRGISSLLAGFPALIKASSILGFPEKMKSLTYLPQLFKKNGYELSFYYGGDLDFYNTNIMLVQSGIDKVVARSQFPLKQSTMQKWGAPDEYLYKRLGDDIQTMKRPYFSIVYNISSHEPFDVPNHYNKIKGTSNSDRYLNSIAYTDSCL